MGSGIGSRRHPFDAGTLTDRLTDWPPTGHKGTALGGRPSHRPSLATYWAKGTGWGQKLASPPHTNRTTGGGQTRGGTPFLPDLTCAYPA